jgi:5-methylcytosine-specific restriction endonuclease McrA
MSNKQLHKELRKKFNLLVFTRDDNKCKVCGRTYNLDAHHITDRHEMPNGGYTISNGITLCDECHKEAETFHKTNKEFWYAGFHPNDLYELIDSSFDKAYNDSLKLSSESER